MSQSSEGSAPGAQDMSALLDGELDDTAVGRACMQWRDSDEARSRWHAYHLIGDVLRSDDLASSPEHDRAFLARLRGQLAQEPVVLAPAAAAQLPADEVAAVLPQRRHWRSSVAVAAGFAAVAGVLVVTQMSGGLPGPVVPAGAGLVAQQGVPSLTAVRAGAALPDRVVEPSNDVLNGQLIRDARLDDYLAAHKKFGGSSAPGGPSGFMRNAAAEGR